jgi:hypothetical protein
MKPAPILIDLLFEGFLVRWNTCSMEFLFDGILGVIGGAVGNIEPACQRPAEGTTAARTQGYFQF